VFCHSFGDTFDNKIPAEWRHGLFKTIRETPNLDWLLLTKRPQLVKRHLLDIGMDTLPSNVWLGTTVENQEEGDRRIPHLLAVPATVHFLSCEPLLGPLDLRTYIDALDWVIAGGESGPKARPAHPDWFRDLRDQCQKAGVPFHFKQWGEWTPGENVDRQSGVVKSAHWFGDDWRFGRENLASDDGHFDDQPDLYRVGKKEAGRRLDGETHDGFPARMLAAAEVR
jgi:protein gp37